MLIQSQLTLSGRATGFRAGDKQIQLAWNVTDGVGQFDRIQLKKTGTDTKTNPIDIPTNATLIIFIPGVNTDAEKVRDTNISNAEKEIQSKQETLENLEKKNKDTTIDTAARPTDADVTSARTALETAKSSFEALKNTVAVNLSISGSETEQGFPISSTSPTILTANGIKSSTLHITTDNDLPGCELIIL